MESSPLLRAEQLGRRKTRGEGWLLREIDCRVCAGDRIAVTGPSGAGKSLLLRALVQLDPLDTGAVYWRGQTVADRTMPEFRAAVMYVPQRPASWDGRVEDLLRSVFELRVHKHKSYQPARIGAWLDALHRSDALLRSAVRDLSGGESLLVALLCAAQLDPQILLLDEPTSALDAASTKAVESLIGDWQSGAEEERAVIWVSHDRRQAHRVADRIWTLRDGQLAEEP